MNGGRIVSRAFVTSPALPAVDWLHPAATLPLPALGVIRATGPEARSFLQSQLTNDATKLSDTQGQLSGYCSPKGRLLAVFTALQLAPDDFALALPGGVLAPTLKRLKMFVLRSKLVLEDASDAFVTQGLLGETIESTLAAAGIAMPIEPYGVTRCHNGWLLRRPGPLPRFEWRGSAADWLTLDTKLALPLATAGDWSLADVLAGIPQVLPETVDHFVPQTIDLDTAGGVSFTKGCYPGQEIVARVHYLGRVKQRLRLARGAVALPAGTALLDADERSVATVMASAAHPAQGAILALSLNVSHEQGALHMAGSDDAVWPNQLTSTGTNQGPVIS